MGHGRLSLHQKFPFPPRGGDWFDDWVVGLQFEPYCLHHPVFRYRTRPDTCRFVPRNAAFLVLPFVSDRSLRAQMTVFIRLSLHRKIPFLARCQRLVR